MINPRAEISVHSAAAYSSAIQTFVFFGVWSKVASALGKVDDSSLVCQVPEKDTRPFCEAGTDGFRTNPGFCDSVAALV